ncbi:MAG: hypothetical protein MRJ93_07125 [Nitrososphaeraceae archaeon]|nr:hypothetical protein [Nitrososphaeraceae archaeon]
MSDKTILFSYRLDRIVKTENTTNITDNWSIGVDSFAVDAHNDVLAVDQSENKISLLLNYLIHFMI